jgi:hypothetical protein
MELISNYIKHSKTYPDTFRGHLSCLIFNGSHKYETVMSHLINAGMQKRIIKQCKRCKKIKVITI